MRKEDRAAQIWSVLALAARNRQILTYEILARLIGVPMPALGRLLEPVQSFCLKHQFPPLTALVVSSESGRPGSGYTAGSDVPAMQQRVFALDWLKVGCPSPEELAEALRTHPSRRGQWGT